MELGMTRRDLLRAGAAAGAVALTADPLVKAALAAAPRPGKLSDIEHVVILIQENRSFDHYFGTMAGVRGFNDAIATGDVAQPGYPVAGFEGELLPFHLATNGAPQCFPDITHQWVPQHESWDGGAMDGFVRAHLAVDGSAAGPATMGYYEAQDIPYYRALAQQFTLCDGYHCAVMGPTDPNRLYSMTGTIDPEGLAGGPLVETLLLDRRNRFSWTTMPEQLSAAGISWKIYDGTGEGVLDNVLTYFKAYNGNAALEERAFAPEYPHDFLADLHSKELPQVSWINMSIGETEHPGYSTAAVGEHSMAKVLNQLLHHQDTWRKTALFVTWDENGGFYDHVAPPVPEAGTPGEFLTAPDISGSAGGIAGPIGLGYRVPMIVASPFSRGGFLCSDTFDHTSILRFLETRFGVEVPNLSQWRRETTGDLTSAFNFAQPDFSNPSLPAVHLSPKEVKSGGCETSGPVTVPANSLPQQEEGGSWRTPSGL
jgi:phospholipase C